MNSISGLRIEVLHEKFVSRTLTNRGVKSTFQDMHLRNILLLALDSSICTAAHIKSDLVWNLDTLKEFVCFFKLTLSLGTPYMFTIYA